MKKRSLPLDKVAGLLEPGPVVLLTTSFQGRPNVMTLSWLTMMEFTPLVGCIVSDANYSFAALKKTKECVINIPTANLIKKVVAVGNSSGEHLDKFEKFKLTPLPATQVAAPLIAECFVNLECRVVDMRLVNKYNFFILEVVQAWSSPVKKPLRTIHYRRNSHFMISGREIKIASKK